MVETMMTADSLQLRLDEMRIVEDLPKAKTRYTWASGRRLTASRQRPTEDRPAMRKVTRNEVSEDFGSITTSPIY